MKRFLALLLALVMCASMAACSETPAEPTTEATVATEPETFSVFAFNALIDGKPVAELTEKTTVTATAEPQKTPEPTPEPTPAPVETTPEPTLEPNLEPTPEAAPENDLKATAESFIGASLDELIAAIGEPESSDYAPSCLGDGEDGNLYYDGFVVYTYRENGTETVEYVE